MGELHKDDIIPLTLKVSDLKSIGHTIYPVDQEVNFVCSLQTANLEGVILRNIIAHLGYEMDEGSDSYSKEGVDLPDSVTFATSMPWDEYRRITD